MSGFSLPNIRGIGWHRITAGEKCRTSPENEFIHNTESSNLGYDLTF